MQFKNNVALLAVLFVAGVSSSPSYIPYSEPEVQTPEQESVSPSQIDTVPVPLETSGTTNEIFIPEPVTTIPQPPPTRTSAYLPPVHRQVQPPTTYFAVGPPIFQNPPTQPQPIPIQASSPPSQTHVVTYRTQGCCACPCACGSGMLPPLTTSPPSSTTMTCGAPPTTTPTPTQGCSNGSTTSQDEPDSQPPLAVTQEPTTPTTTSETDQPEEETPPQDDEESEEPEELEVEGPTTPAQPGQEDVPCPTDPQEDLAITSLENENEKGASSTLKTTTASFVLVAVAGAFLL